MVFHIDSPLVESTELPKYISNGTKTNVLLKMDALQPSGSFKIRGISNCCWKAVNEHKCSRLVSSSGGNAGLAVAYSGQQLNVPVTVIVPESTSPYMIKKIQDFGADVQVFGAAWDDANTKALEIAAQPGCFYVHPFDNVDLWEGHSTIIKEIADKYQLHKTKPIFQKKPDVLITVVGGGGLLTGILVGMHSVGWSDVPIIAAETDGAHSFHESVKNNKLITLPAITSIAKTLGAKTVCAEVFEWSKKHQIIPVIVSDKMAVDACVKFADEHRILVEPSCGAGLSVIYNNLPELQEIIKDKQHPTVLVIVCGGSGVTLELLQNWKQVL